MYILLREGGCISFKGRKRGHHVLYIFICVPYSGFSFVFETKKSAHSNRFSKQFPENVPIQSAHLTLGEDFLNHTFSYLQGVFNLNHFRLTLLYSINFFSKVRPSTYFLPRLNSGSARPDFRPTPAKIFNVQIYF